MIISEWLHRVRDSRPLVHNMTNLVVNNIVANALLALGASPVMAYANEEVGDMAAMAGALALNMGTLNPSLVSAMQVAGQSAQQAGVPIVFDPVGVGATKYRTQTANAITSQLQLTVLRGNAGEIGVMVDSGGRVSGVDSQGAEEGLPYAMKQYAMDHHVVVVDTGETDFVTDGETIWKLQNGHPLLATVTGSGCSLTGIIGAFLAVVDDLQNFEKCAKAVIAAITCVNVAAEQAATVAKGPGTFQAAWLDALYHLSDRQVDHQAIISVLDMKL